MTPAVADFQSQQPHGQGAQLPNFQFPNPSFAAHFQGEIQSRSRRKHKKVKKQQVGSRNPVPVPVPPTTSASVSYNNNNNHSFTDDLIASIDANNNGSVSKLNSGGGDFEGFENVGFVVGSGSVGIPGPKFENVGFVFGASKGSSSFNVDLSKLPKNANVENVGANLNKDSSDVNFAVGGNGKPEARELRANGFGKFSVGCAFGASKSDTVLNSNKGSGRLDEREKTVDYMKIRKFKNLDFVFSASREDSMSDANLREEGIKGNGGESVNVSDTEKSKTGVFSADCDDLGFVFPENSNSSNDGDSKYTESWGKFGDACFKFGAAPRDSIPSGNMEEKESGTSLENLNFVERKQSVDIETKFQGKVKGASESGNDCDASYTFDGSRKLFDGMNNSKLNSEVDITIGSHLRSKFNFVFGSMNNLGSDSMPVSNISDEMQALNINDHAKVNAASDNTKDSNINQGANTFNGYMFGSDRKNVSPTESATTKSWDQQNEIGKAGVENGCAIPRNEGVNNVHAFGSNGNTREVKKTEGVSMGYSLGNNGNAVGSVGVKVLHEGMKSFGVTEKENHPHNLNGNSLDGGEIPGNQPKTDTELKFDSFPSSSTSSGLSFLPKVSPSEAPPSNKVEMTNNCSFTSTPVGFGASFTGFSTPNLKFSHSFTANLVPDLNKNLEFSLNSSVGDKGLKKTRRKSRQRILVRQRAARTNLLKEGAFQQNQESPGCCSPMDFSPYQDTNCEPSSTKSTELTKERDEESDDGKSQFCFPSTSTNSVEGNFKFSATPFAQGEEVSSTKPRHQKKYKMKIGRGGKSTTSSRKVSISNEQSTEGNISDAEGKHSRQERTDATQDECQKWRIRGNQAYKDGDLLKAETCYTKGVHSIPQNNTSGLCSDSLVLCYSNRAATRMSLGRVREALEDCKMAASLDTTFIKVHLRAANCHLVLGEVKDAICNYNKCLETGPMVCLDRRFTIEAADGLQKAQKVVDCGSQSAELLQQKTFDSAAKALEVISGALAISCYSEKLLELKGEALLLLRKHEDVIQLCEQTLAFAERNFTTVGVANPATNVDGLDRCNSPKLWRWGLLSRSYFSLGRLDRALDFIEKREKLGHGWSQESSSNLAVTIRELLQCKNAGNEAFQSGRHTEAIEHYTNAISKSVESRPFAAVCICNCAAAHQALGELIDAIADCSLAIALDRNYSKALSRRATLHEMIRDYDEAANDLRRLISILEKQSIEKSQQSGTADKSTGSSVKDLRRARRRLSALEEKAKKGMPLDLYLILGLKASDTSSEVKKAYRKAALRHHPDKAGQILLRSDCGGDEQQWKEILETIHMDADRLFKMIGEANAVLSDSTKRSKYDLEEEIRRDDQENTGSTSYRRPSNFYSSPFESSNRRSQERRKAYGNSSYWQESWKTYGESTHW